MLKKDCLNLDNLSVLGQVSCPYCAKGRIFSYGATGKISQQCSNCRNYFLVDLDGLEAYKTGAKRINNR